MRCWLLPMLIVALGCCTVECNSGELSDEIRLPTLPIEVPKVVPDPAPITELPFAAWYVIESDVPLIVLASPNGLVSVTAEAGPLRMRGVFADGCGVETRLYSAAHIYTVEAMVTGNVELLIVPQSAESADDVIRRTLRVMGMNPMPPPVPDPDVNPPKPDPKPPVPDPIQTGPLKVLIIEETADRASLPPAQAAILTARAIRAYCDRKCSKTDGQVDFRVLDADQDVSTAAVWIQTAFREPRESLPFLLVSNGSAGWAGPLPSNIDETLKLLQRYGGE